MKKSIIDEVKAEVKAKKQPKTIKVVTLVKVGVLVAALASAFYAGMWVNAGQTQAYNSAVISEAKTIVSELKSSQSE